MLAKPYLDWNQSGSYSAGFVSGTLNAGLGAASEVFQFRWTDASKVAAIRSIRLGAGDTATAFTAGLVYFDLVVARSWTADGTGGTAITYGTNDNKRRTAYQTTASPSNLGVRIASTAALGAGTKTLDGNALANISTSVSVTAGAPLVPPGTVLFGYDITSEHPLVLAQNEGFVIRATVPATGTWQFGLTIDWTELLASGL